MFISDANNLPPTDDKSEAIWRSVKAKSTYGPILEKVISTQKSSPTFWICTPLLFQVQAEKSRGTYGQHVNNTLAIEHENGDVKSGMKENQVVAVNPQSSSNTRSDPKSGSSASSTVRSNQTEIDLSFTFLPFSNRLFK